MNFLEHDSGIGIPSEMSENAAFEYLEYISCSNITKRFSLD
jgi:hypothetical protein